MSRFAHMADVHLGAHREPALQKMELAAFDRALTKCIEVDVDFVLISGDLFHVGIPDLGIVNSAVRKMVELRSAGIPLYVIYGSHDYTPTGTSVIDLLNTAGVLTNLSRWKVDGTKLELEVLEDTKTGAKLTGISARKIGLERKYYDMLDREALEKVPGFKVFAFHSGLTEFKPAFLREMETVGISSFPKGFDYYAGGHIHERGEFELPGYQKVVFPGPLFSGYGRDVEDTAKGEKRGFYLVEFDQKLRKTEFVPLETFGGIYREFDANGKNAMELKKEIKEDLDATDVSGKVVVLRVRGELSGGRVVDVDFGGLRLTLAERGAVYVYLNRYALTSRESRSPLIAGADPEAIERELFESEIARVKVSQAVLTGSDGAATAQTLLRVLKQPTKAGEAKRDYQRRVVSEGMEALQMSRVLEEME